MSDTTKYPIYIISKGRAHRPITHNALNRMNTAHYIVVEASDYDDYKHLNAEILILPESFIDDYDTCDDVTDMPKGSGPARNFCMQHSLDNGHNKHWVIDDNLEDFYRLNRNIKHIVRTNAIFQAAENFTDRYSNVPMSGFNYESFAKSTDAIPPFYINTKVYSCILLDNTAGFKWRGRYNEDVDLSLRILKSGQCTIQFNAFLSGKVTTQRVRGGNTDSIYVDGTAKKSEMLAKLHPDVAKVVTKFNRPHHQVDYSGFTTELKLIKPLKKQPINNYGMRLIEIK